MFTIDIVSGWGVMLIKCDCKRDLSGEYIQLDAFCEYLGTYCRVIGDMYCNI